jgi:hypothetical protein
MIVGVTSTAAATRKVFEKLLLRKLANQGQLRLVCPIKYQFQRFFLICQSKINQEDIGR